MSRTPNKTTKSVVREKYCVLLPHSTEPKTLVVRHGEGWMLPEFLPDREHPELPQAQQAIRAQLKIEAGILSPEAVQGEVHKWIDPEGRWGDLPMWRAWRVEVDAEPAPVDGLTVVTIHVVKDTGSGEAAPLYELRQVISLRPPEPDGIGAEDPLAADLESGGGP